MTTFATTHTINGLVRINGLDAERFLQGQLTCDMTELSPNKALPGAFCSPQGRIRASFVILQLESNDYLLILPREQIAFIMEVMAPYVAFFQCTMTDSSDDWHCFGLIDNQDKDSSELTNMPELINTKWNVNRSSSVCCIRLPGGTSRWLCLSQAPIDDIIKDIPFMETDEWQKQDMLSGLIWINETNRDKFLPHDLSMPDLGAVSFTKGCYTGQEIIARMQYRGKPKYLLAIITTEPTDEKIPEKLIQLGDNSKEIKIGTTIEQLHLSDKSWLISASVKTMLINQQNFQLSSNERSILCIITTPEIAKESINS